MRKAIAVLLTLCLLLGLTACGSEPVKMENTPTEKKTTTTTAPVEESLSYDKIVGTVRQIMKKYSGYTGITNEETIQREDGTTARTFKYFNDLFWVTVSLQGDTVINLTVLGDPNKLTELTDNPYGVFSLVASFPALPFYDKGKWDCDENHTALANALEETREINMETNSVSFRLAEDGWQYVVQCTPLVCSFFVSAEQPTTTTAATSGTTAAKPTASKQTTPTQNKTTGKTTTEATDSNQATKPTGSNIANPDTGKTTGKTTNKTTTATNPQNQDPCAHGHDWKDVYETVYYEEVGHYENVISGYDKVTTYKCAMCYEPFASLNAYYSHFTEHEASSGQFASIFKDRYETVTEQKPIYTKEWVVDEPAHTQQEWVGYECRECGEKKN